MLSEGRTKLNGRRGEERRGQERKGPAISDAAGTSKFLHIIYDYIRKHVQNDSYKEGVVGRLVWSEARVRNMPPAVRKWPEATVKRGGEMECTVHLHRRAGTHQCMEGERVEGGGSCLSLQLQDQSQLDMNI